MAKDRHTGGKWTVTEKINEYAIEDLEQPYASPVASGMTKETAILIVQMHNSHGGLVEALKEALEWIYFEDYESQDDALGRSKAIKLVRKAIAQASE